MSNKQDGKDIVGDTLRSLIWKSKVGGERNEGWCSVRGKLGRSTGLEILWMLRAGFLDMRRANCGTLSAVSWNAVSPLHTNLNVVSFQRCERASCSSKEPEPVPSMSGVSEIAACSLSHIADDPSALPSPTSSSSSNQSLFLPVRSMPAPVCQLLYCTTVLFKVL